MYKINPDSTWAKLPRWKKRIEGFKCYIVAAFASVFTYPEVVDSVMLKELKRNFLDEEIT